MEKLKGIILYFEDDNEEQEITEFAKEHGYTLLELIRIGLEFVDRGF